MYIPMIFAEFIVIYIKFLSRPLHTQRSRLCGALQRIKSDDDHDDAAQGIKPIRSVLRGTEEREETKELMMDGAEGLLNMEGVKSSYTFELN